jgi:uncharacterized protein (DUF362 family)
MVTNAKNTLIGIYHFLGDKAPENAPLVLPRPRVINPWMRDGKALVAKIKVTDNLLESVEKLFTLLGNIDRGIGRGDKVFLKSNFNSSDPFPASTDLHFLQAIVEILKDAGARITIGESAGGIWRPTRSVFQRLDLYEFARRMDVELIAFEDRPDDWVKVQIKGQYFATVTMPRSAYEADKLVYTPCMKTHFLAHYSGALKLAMGFMHPGNRRAMHMGKLQKKIAEINLCWQPNLIIQDGRKAFVTGGPHRGKVAEPGILMASGDSIAIDVEAVKTLFDLGAQKRLPANPWQLPQIATALKYDLGVAEGGYAVVE